MSGGGHRRGTRRGSRNRPRRRARPARERARHDASSMQRDLDAGIAPELDAIAGPILCAGRAHGISTPATLLSSQRSSNASSNSRVGGRAPSVPVTSYRVPPDWTSMSINSVCSAPRCRTPVRSRTRLLSNEENARCPSGSRDDLRGPRSKALMAQPAPRCITGTSGHCRFITVSAAAQIGGRSMASPPMLDCNGLQSGRANATRPGQKVLSDLVFLVAGIGFEPMTFGL